MYEEENKLYVKFAGFCRKKIEEFAKVYRQKKICYGLLSKLSEKNNHKIFLYPQGDFANLVRVFLKKRGYSGVHIVENLELCAAEIKHDCVLVITCDDEKYFNYHKIQVNNVIGLTDDKVIDLFPAHPLFRSNGRNMSLIATAKNIYHEGIDGCVAEVGVYRGDFAKYINMVFPDRKLYLFDTFEGFTENMVNSNDKKEETDTFIELLKDTSVDTVMEKMTFKNKVVIKKGFFPETAADLSDTFCFVNLDTDLYKPIYDGLVYFWDRMAPGGSIFVHDFYLWSGVREAVLQFCVEKHLGYYNLSDGDSVCVVKPIEKKK